MIDGFADASIIFTEALNVLDRPASFSVVPLQIMVELVMCTFSGEEALKQ